MSVAEDSGIPLDRGDKGGEIVRCLGYRHFHQDDTVDVDGVIGDILRAALGAQNNAERSNDVGLVDQVDLWHVRSLAIQPGGLLLSFGRKSGWIKLAGVDQLVFNEQLQQQQEEERASTVSSLASERSYDEIQRQLGREMEPSLWHIQRERRRLRKNERRSYPSNFSSTLSQASSMTDLSSYGGSTNGDGTSGSSTPLTCNLNSRSGTPKSVSFGSSEKMSVPAGAPFTAFATKNYRDMSSVSSASFRNRFINMNKENEENGSRIDPSPLHSPFILPSPAGLPQSSLNHSNGVILKPNNPYIPYQNNNQMHHKPFPIKARAKKDKRPKERKLLIQIASSAFYMIERKGCSDGAAVAKLFYYPGMQDLIAILLLHLESPSLASLVLRQIIESHLAIFCIEYTEEGNEVEEEKIGMHRSSSDASFHSCIETSDREEEDVEVEVETERLFKLPEGGNQSKSWDLLSLSFFPVLALVDEEMYSSLTANGLLNSRIFVFAEVLKKWISSWFCSQEDMPLEVVSRIIDFLLASHPSMPLYLSIAFVCHPVTRDKFLLPSLEPSPTAFSETNIFNQNSEEEAESSHDEEDLLQPAQSSPRKPSSPRDRQLSKMLQNLFTDLTNELSTITHLNPFTGDVDKCSLDEKSCTENIISFVEDSICTAISFMKQVPPNTLNTLVSEYNDGFLRNYLDPREQARSFRPLPWALRASAPTDHVLPKRTVDTDSTKALGLPKYLNEKHQIALDASGLDMNQKYFGLDKMQRNKIALLVALAIGCIGATFVHKPSPTEVIINHNNKAPAQIDAVVKQPLLKPINIADKSVPIQEFSPKKADLFDFLKHDKVADRNEDKLKPLLSSTQNAILPDEGAADTTNPTIKSDNVKDPAPVESETLKKEDTSSNADTATKEKPNILRTVRKMIRSAICAIRNRSRMSCE